MNMSENVKRKIEFEKEAWKSDVERIENYRPEKPEKPSVLRALLLYITILAIVLSVDVALIFVSGILAEIIVAVGVPADFFITYSLYTCKRNDYKAWKESLKYKAEELEKIARKYTTRIQNLERFGFYKKKASAIRTKYACTADRRMSASRRFHRALHLSTEY